jgi:para-nitrobenzyl esterase
VCPTPHTRVAIDPTTAHSEFGGTFGQEVRGIMMSAGTDITIETGTLRGAVEGGISHWLGIPFALPPVGELRWRAPQPATSWTGVRDATAYANDPMQIPVDIDAAPIGTTPSEDCLYANVWRPRGSTAGLPVLVWIYGGGFVNGGSSPRTYTGARLASDGLVVVSFNYRVGRFGTFAHRQLTAEDRDGGLGCNYGILDQVAALNWVQRNIAAFGGDTANVTVVGESAGGASIHMLMTSPLAQGLFHKAAIMSGGTGERTGSATLTDIEQLGQAFATHNGIEPDDSEALPKLRALSAAAVAGDLNLLTMTSHRPFTFAGPFVDGKIVVDPGPAYAAGAFARVPLMVGATSDDFDGKTGFMIGGARRFSNRLSAMGVPVYQFRFSYVAECLRNEPDQLGSGAKHASDIPFFFNTQDLKYGDRTTEIDNRMGRLISTHLTQFAKTGDPSHEGAAWPRYTPGPDGILMDFTPDGRGQAKADPWAHDIDSSPERAYPDFVRSTQS